MNNNNNRCQCILFPLLHLQQTLTQPQMQPWKPTALPLSVILVPEVFPVEVSRTLTKELKGNIAQNSDNRIGT